MLFVCTLIFVLGDMMFLSHILALGAHFGRDGKNCLFCEVESCELFKKDPSKKRSLKRLYQMAHLLGPGEAFPFTCPGCGRAFSSQADIDNEEQPTNAAEYEKGHASTGWHRRPLINVEPSHIVMCCLHLILFLTKLLFKKGFCG